MCQKCYCYLNTKNCCLNTSTKQPCNSGERKIISKSMLSFEVEGEKKILRADRDSGWGLESTIADIRGVVGRSSTTIQENPLWFSSWPF